MKGTQDGNHNIIPESFLFEIMMNCIEFEEYNTLLQPKVLEIWDHGDQLFLDLSPKCKCELSGEVIGYAWVCANNYYWVLTKANKKGKDNCINSAA